MKKLFVLLLAVILCIQIPLSLAEDVEENNGDRYVAKIPNYFEMQENKVLIGTSPSGVDVYEFEYTNPVYDYSGCFRLLNPDEFEKALKKHHIAYTQISVVSVMAHHFLVVTLIDGQSYGFDLFRTYDEAEYVTLDSLRVFCLNYYGNGYDFYGV